MRIGAIICAACLSWQSIAAAQPATTLPAAVTAERNKDIADCRQDGNARADFTDQGSGPYLETADFNGDGRTDYVIEHESLMCVGPGFSDRLDCSASGCDFVVFVSQSGDAYTRVEGWMADGVGIGHAGNRVALMVSDQPWLWNGHAFACAPHVC